MKVKHTNLINILLLSGFLALPLSHLFVPSVYADNLDFTVNITPSLTVTIPESTVSLNSQDLSITVGTNNPTGYTLSMTSTSTDLTRTIPFSDGSFATLSTLDTLSGGYTEDTFTTNRWGYKLGNNNYQPFALTNTINSSSSPVNADTTNLTFGAKVDFEQAEGDTTNLTFGAKVDFEQAEGTYELSLSFTAVANVVPIATMQSLTLSQCQAEASDTDAYVTDERDNNLYTVRYINGECWMTQNLRTASGTELTPADSNVATNYTIPTADLTSGNSFTEGRVHDSGNLVTGYWYNLCAASAGTSCSDTNASNTTYDICPAGWRLPTTEEQNNIINYASAYAPEYGGYYGGGTLNLSAEVGSWWASTAYSNAYQYRLSYIAGNLNSYYASKLYGFYVRCVKSS